LISTEVMFAAIILHSKVNNLDFKFDLVSDITEQHMSYSR